jgi:MazG family protein
MTSQNQWQDTQQAFGALCETIAALRHPVTGCPWDLEQTHSSLRKYMIEEAYEAAEVMDPTTPEKLKEELGDVLLQVVLNAQLARDAGTFAIKDVIEGLDAKMRRRHPHVFGDQSTKESRDKHQIRAKWEDIKASEKRLTEGAEPSQEIKGVFSDLKPSAVTPASQLAMAIGSLARKIHFDWPDPSAVFAQFESEVAELRDEIQSGGSHDRISSEMSDVFFSLFQLCRHLGVDPEISAMDGNRKFLTRFRTLEIIAAEEGYDVKSAGTQKLEELWQKAKTRENRESR